MHLLRSALAESLGDEVVYLSWDDDSQQLEDDARELRARIRDGEPVEPDDRRARHGDGDRKIDHARVHHDG